MTSPEISPARLPYHLMPRTVGNLEIESPRFINPDRVYLRDDTGELFVYSDDLLDSATRNPRALMGKVGLMKAVITDPKLTNTQHLLTGYVVDLRFVPSTDKFDAAPPAEKPDDDEEANAWFEDMKTLVPIASIAFTHEQGSKEIDTTGDARFAKAALHLASLADELDHKLKQQAKVATNKPTRKTSKARKK